MIIIGVVSRAGHSLRPIDASSSLPPRFAEILPSKYSRNETNQSIGGKRERERERSDPSRNDRCVKFPRDEALLTRRFFISSTEVSVHYDVGFHPMYPMHRVRGVTRVLRHVESYFVAWNGFDYPIVCVSTSPI